MKRINLAVCGSYGESHLMDTFNQNLESCLKEEFLNSFEKMLFPTIYFLQQISQLITSTPNSKCVLIGNKISSLQGKKKKNYY